MSAADGAGAASSAASAAAALDASPAASSDAAPSAAASSAGVAGALGARQSALVERFVALDDVVARELEDLEFPWNLKAIEDRIQEYTRFSEAINAQLSARVMANYNEFVQGMQQVQAVETELTLIGVLTKNSRRKLQERDLGLVTGSMRITRQHRKSQRIKQLQERLADLQSVVKIERQLRDCLEKENYCEAISQHAALREALAAECTQGFPGLRGLREGLDMHLGMVRQKLSDGLRIACVSSYFDAQRYEEILKAYAMMSSDQSLPVGQEILKHVSDCIHAVSRQCMLAYSAVPACEESPSEWYRKAQLRDLCRSMDPSCFVECIAKLYEHLCDFLFRHQFLCQWHASRCQAEHGDAAASASFREVLQHVLTELSVSKRSVWDRIQQQVSLVLMTMEFQYPTLSEDGFLHVVHLTQVLIEEGDAFMSDYQPPRSHGAGADGRRQWSNSIRNTLKAKANDYFESLHYKVWAAFKQAYLEQDTWQRLPVARSYSLLRAGRLHTALPKMLAVQSAADGGKARTSESNPFRNYKADALVPIGGESDMDGKSAGDMSGASPALGADEIDEHLLLQHWIGDNETLPNEQIGSSMLSNSNRSLVVSKSTEELARVLERYFRMMSALPQLAPQIFEALVQLLDFYVHCVLCLFVQDHQLRCLLEELQIPPPGAPPDSRLQGLHEAFLVQRLCPELRRAALRVREKLAELASPCSPTASLLQVPITEPKSFPKLSSPSALCGLSERCVGVESVGAVLGELREMREWISGLLRGGGQEVIERFFVGQEAVAAELRAFVLMCAARDLLEKPDVGRISMDHFSNTVQSLRWESKDFSQGSPAGPYLEQLRNQIDELGRRIPCAGGGSIPLATQRVVWGWAEVRVMQECVEVIAKVGRKKTQEALFCMAEDFEKLRKAMQANLKAADGAEERSSLLPADHPLAATVCWEYLHQYLEAHGIASSDVVVWCKRHQEYPLRLHRSLIEYLQGGNQKAMRQGLGELETFYAGYIADECAASAGGVRGI